MKQDLFNFTTNPYYMKMIYDKGLSLVVAKSIFAFLVLPLPFYYLLHNCPNYKYITFHEYYEFIFLGLMILFSAYYSQLYLSPLLNNYKSKSWKSTTAEIIEIGIFKVKVARRFGSTIEYFPAIIYKFKLDNKIYQNKNFSFESDYIYNYSLNPNASNQYHDINKKFAQWVENKKLKIYYDPKNPNKSVVIKNFHPLRKFFYFFLSILALISFLTSIFDFICLLFLSYN